MDGTERLRFFGIGSVAYTGENQLWDSVGLSNHTNIAEIDPGVSPLAIQVIC